MNNNEIAELYKTQINNPENNAKINITELLNLEKNTHHYLYDISLEIITQNIYNTINELPIESNKKHEICKKLTNYRYIDEIKDLHIGKHIRWIPRNKYPKLMPGGIVTNFKFTDSGTYVLCKLAFNPHSTNFVQINFDDMIIYQKLSTDEQLILAMNSYITTK